jgi:hypothetical protein
LPRISTDVVVARIRAAALLELDLGVAAIAAATGVAFNAGDVADGRRSSPPTPSDAAELERRGRELERSTSSPPAASASRSTATSPSW